MKRTLLTLGLLVAVLPLAGCPSQQRQQVAQALQTASTVVQSFQQAEIASAQQGVISAEDHQFIEAEILTLAQAGKTADTCVKTTTNVAGDIACVNALVATVDNLNSQGALHIKSADAKEKYQLAMVGVKAALQTITAILGGK